MVDVGASGVPVLFQNQKIGQSGRDGRLVVRNLSAFDDNKIAIDPRMLALDLEAADTEKLVVPIDGGGVLVRFGVAKSPPSALVTLRLADGGYVPAGAEAVRAGASERIIVGYDGQVFLTDLHATNDLTVYLEDGVTCAARFAFSPGPKEVPVSWKHSVTRILILLVVGLGIGASGWLAVPTPARAASCSVSVGNGGFGTNISPSPPARSTPRPP